MPLALMGFLLSASFNPSILTVNLETVVEVTTTPQDVWLDALHNCENEYNVPKILDTNGYYSYGAYMFQMKTWLAYGKEFGATRENISSSTLQRKVAKSMLDAGGQNHWYNCSLFIRKTLGKYPVDLS